MSGSTIGGIAGGIIGFVVTGFNPAGAQWGFMIGSAVGAIVDPEKIEGPRLKDASNQTANDGIPRTYGYGRFPSTGNVIWRDIVKEVKNTESGKGGPEVTTYTYTRSYAIAVCKGPISGYLIIKRNGKIVFDARPDAELAALGYTSEMISETRAAQAKFMEVCTFYYGDQTTPDPTMVAVKGAGNVPNYTGTAFIVLTDDETREGEIAQYEFVVADCGERHDDDTVPAILLVTGQAKTMGGPVFAYARAEAEPEFEGIAQSTGADITGATASWSGDRWVAVNNGNVRYANISMVAWSDGTITTPTGFGQIMGSEAGWLTVIPNNNDAPTAFVASTTTPIEFTRVSVAGTNSLGSPTTGFQSAPYLINANGWYILSGARYFAKSDTPGGPYVSVWDGFNEVASGRDPNGPCIMGWYDLCEFEGEWYAVIEWDFRDSFKRCQLIKSHNGIEDWSTFDVLVDTDMGGDYMPGQLCPGGGVLVCYTVDGQVWTSSNGWAAVIATGLTGPGSGQPGVLMVGGRRIVYVDNRFYLIGATDQCVVIEADPFAISDPITLPVDFTVSLSVSSGEIDLTPIPDAPGYYIDPETGLIVGPPGTSIDSCTPTLGSIVADQCAKRNVTTVDVSELTDPVTGYRVASVTSPQQNIAGLMPAFFFDSSQFDGTIHFPKRGRDATFALTIDDLVERDGDPIQWERTQEPELLRKLTVGYIDPATTFTPTTQEWERRAGTIKAQGEGTMELPVVMGADEAAQVADKAGKVAWAEAERCTFHVSRAWAKLVTAAVGTITDRDGVTYRVRITKIEDDGGIRMISAIRDRQTAYQSTVNGAQKPLPLFPGSNIRGPTLAAVMNMPAGLDSYDHPGLTWAAAGITDGWVGARLQVMRAGEWVTLGDITTPCSVGTLVSDLPAHSGDIDTANVMRIRMDDPLSSVTFTQLLNERNPVAIMRDDHTVEVVQFQDAVQDSDGVWECTTLIRGNLDTDPSGHDAGATVVLLDGGIQFVDLRPDDVGATLSFRVVSLGTDPDAAVPFDITFPYIWSSTEWPVAYLDVEKDGDDFILTWLERRRLGTDANPIRSVNWEGYDVRYEHAGGSGSVIVTDPTHTFTLPGATDIDFTVVQLNRLTGRGPETMVNHE